MTSPLTTAEMEEIATQVISEDFNTSYAATGRLETSDAADKAAVYATALLLAEERLKQSIASGDSDKVLWALYYRADLAQKFDDYVVARDWIKELIAWERKHPRWFSSFYPIVAGWYQEQGNLRAARKYMEKAVLFARRTIKIDGHTSDLLLQLGIIAAAQGEVDYARQRFAESIEFQRAWCKAGPDREPGIASGHYFRLYYECATSLLAQKQAVPAIPLLAAAQVIGQRLEGVPENHHKHALFQTAIAQARGLTDADSFDQAWEAGLTMTPDEMQSHIACP